MQFRLFFLGAALAGSMVLGGCAGSGATRTSSAEDAFNRGLQYFERERYAQAVPYFQAVFEYGQTGEWVDDAQLYLARSYAGNGEYILAAAAFSRFSELYRNDPRREEAEYERAMAYYELSPAYQLDQTETERAIRQFQAFIERFPASPLVADAETRIRELREKMAHKQYEVGKLYVRREYYEAAALAFEEVFDRYPDTPWADDALVAAMEAYINFSDLSVQTRQVERLQKAVENYRRLVQVFPDSPHRARAEELNQQATQRIEGINGVVAAGN